MGPLEEMRQNIDDIDNAIIAMIAERFKVTDRVGAYKAENGLPPIDKAREAKQYDRINDLSLENDLEPEIAKAYLSLMIERVVKRHKVLADKFS